MTQGEILKFLKNHPGEFTSKEIAKALDRGRTTTTTCLRRLRKSCFVGYKFRSGPEYNNTGSYYYWSK